MGRTRGRDGEMRGGELQCSKGREKRVREMCGVDLQCSKGGKARVREMCGEFCCVQKVAKHVCGNCAGRFGVLKGWQKNECWKCARKFVATCDSVEELSDHEHLHIVAILAQDECCLISLHQLLWLQAKFTAISLACRQPRSQPRSTRRRL